MNGKNKTEYRYRFGIAWIALNDEPEDLNADAVSGYVSTLLLADLFGKSPKIVAASVVDFRRARLEAGSEDRQTLEAAEAILERKR